MEEPQADEDRKALNLLLRFGGLTGPEAESALAAMESVHLQENGTLFSSGEAGDSAYLLVSGRIELRGNGPDGVEQSLGLLESGALFGELSLLLEQKRVSKALARSDSLLLRLSKPTLDAALQGCENWGIQLLLGISRMLALKLSDTDHKLRGMIRVGHEEPHPLPSNKVAELEQLRKQLFSQWSF